MKILIDREPFANLFNLAAMVAPQRSPKGILMNVRIEATNKEVILSASDMDLSIRLLAREVEIITPGVIVVPVARFASLLKEVTDDQIQIEVVDTLAVITGITTRFELPLRDVEQFPTMAAFDEDNYWEISSRVLKEMIKRTAFAADSESTRYALSGILLESQQPGVLTAVATDGRRLAKMDGAVKVFGQVNEQQTTIVPTRTMLLIERLLPDDDSVVRLAANSNHLKVQTDIALINSRLVEGRYPKWKDAIPKQRDSLKLSILVGTLYTALRQAAVVADDDTRGVDFWFNGGTLIVNSQAAEVGHARIEVPINYDGPDVKTALDLRYLSDMLRVLAADQQLEMDIEGPMTAAYMTTGDSFGYVIMPLTRKGG
jgi:DNA polymerase III subunit beta